MSILKKYKTSEITNLFTQLQVISLQGLGNPELWQAGGQKEPQCLIAHQQKHQQQLETYAGVGCFEQIDSVLNRITHTRGLDTNKNWINVIEWNASFLRVRQKLFRRQKMSQKKQMAEIMKEIEAFEDNLVNQKSQYYKQKPQRLRAEVQIRTHNNRLEKLEFRADDVDKLYPGYDINDTIIENYLKIVKNVFLPSRITSKLHFFSTFFFQKLLGQSIMAPFLDIHPLSPQLSKSQVDFIKGKVYENYGKVKRWTKNTDIFQKDLLVFPINAFNHWFCILVLNPSYVSALDSQNSCQIIYCDSMFEKKDFMIESLKEYLRLELLEKKGKNITPFEENVYSYQLLLPRQTNCHDCGLYMLAYIDQLLSNRFYSLNTMRFVENRHQLSLFPRKLIFTMRQRLLNLIEELSESTSQEHVDKILRKFHQQKRNLLDPSAKYDVINDQSFKKYKTTIKFNKFSKLSDKQYDFCQLIRFYLDSEINYYQKDPQP